jgi:hypothetical protein
MTYTDEELNLLAYVPQLIGSAVSSAAGSGLIGLGKEFFVTASSVMEGIKMFPDNALIRQLVPDPRTDRAKAIEQAERMRDWAVARIKARGVDSAEKLNTLMLEDTKAATEILAAKASPDVARQYRQWAMSVAERVANASTEGGFLGFGGERVSAAEKALIDKVNAVLATA